MPCRIVAVDDGSAIIAGWRVDRIALDRVIIVVAYKVDELTVDLICCDIVADHGGGPTIRTIHEEIPGFTIALDRLATLAGFNRRWRHVVVHPPFAVNRTVLYDRNKSATDQAAG